MGKYISVFPVVFLKILYFCMFQIFTFITNIPHILYAAENVMWSIYLFYWKFETGKKHPIMYQIKQWVIHAVPTKQVYLSEVVPPVDIILLQTLQHAFSFRTKVTVVCTRQSIGTSASCAYVTPASTPDLTTGWQSIGTSTSCAPVTPASTPDLTTGWQSI